MPRKRTLRENKNLPRHWRYRRNAFWYQIPARLRDQYEKTQYRLGSTLHEAHQEFALKFAGDLESSPMETIGQLLNRYRAEVVPLGSKSNQANKRHWIDTLMTVFSRSQLQLIEPVHVRRYIDKRLRDGAGLRVVRGEIEVLRHAYTKAVDWGLIRDHPFMGQVKLPKSKPRDRYVTDDELRAFLEFCNPKLRAYFALKMETGMAKQDLLTLQWSDVRDEGVHFARKKTRSKRKVYQWDANGVLRGIIDDIVAAHKGEAPSLFVFHTRTGDPYYQVNEAGRRESQPYGWDSMFKRAMARHIKNGGIRFTDHDIRAKAASDTSLQQAQDMLDHTRPEITERVYRRAQKVISIRSDRDD